MLDAFLQSMIETMHCDSSLLHVAGVTVVPDPGRAQSHTTAGYMLGEHLVVTCDPPVQAMLSEATAQMEPDLDAWDAVAAELEGQHLGKARMTLMGEQGLRPMQPPDGFQLRSLDRTNDADRGLIAQLIEVSSDEDLNEAELELDDLDETIEVLLDADGQIASYACGRPFDMAPSFGDVGILTRADVRGENLGTAAVAALYPRLLAAGLHPLYRCDEDNVGSVRLSEGMGFEPATMLSVYRFVLG